MARVLNDSLVHFRFAPPAFFAGDDEILEHAEALADGREPAARIWSPPELEDDEIARHVEAEGLTFPVRSARRTRRVRH